MACHDLNVNNYFRGRKQRMVHATLSFIKQTKNFFSFLKFLNAQGLIRAHRVDFFFSKKLSAHVLVLGRPEYLM